MQENHTTFNEFKALYLQSHKTLKHCKQLWQCANGGEFSRQLTVNDIPNTAQMAMIFDTFPYQWKV